MSGSRWAQLAIAVWLMTVVIVAVFFVKGQTVPADDGRVTVMLEETERDFVLAEMRLLLKGVQAITEGVATGDMKQVEAAARSIGADAAADANPALMLKLPLAFKQQGMGLHRQFDQIADKVQAGASAEEALQLLSDQLVSCVSCHETYRLDSVAE